MQQLTKRLTMALICSAFVANTPSFAQSTLFGSGNGQNQNTQVMSPDAFKSKVKDLGQQTKDRLKEQASRALPDQPTSSAKSPAAASQQRTPTRPAAATPQTKPAPASNAPDVYTGFGNTPQPAPKQPAQQPSQPSSGGGWNINY